jgi:hypothetical protein
LKARDRQERSNFATWFRLDRQDRYLIWFSAEADGVVIDHNRNIPVFDSLDFLRQFAAARALRIADEPALLHDLDAVEAWASSDLSNRPDCDECLAAWNLFVDVARSIGHPFDADPAVSAPLHDRLFYASSTANDALRPDGDPVFEPAWSKLERLLLSSLLCDGLEMFRKSLA